MESEWIFRMGLVGSHLSHSKMSFDTAVRSHFLAALFYIADNRFIWKTESGLQGRCLNFRILKFGFHI